MTPSLTELDDLLPIAREAVATARRIIRSRAIASVIAKGERDMVTDIDLAVEEAVRDFLVRETPHIGVLGEEHGHSGATGETSGEATGETTGETTAEAAGEITGTTLWWALDPVDGTANFARGIPLSAVSLGLVADRRSVLAAIDLPFFDLTYTAVAGRGAYAGEERITASPERKLSRALVAIGDFAVGTNAERKNRLRIALLSHLGAREQRIRMLGTAAIDLAWVAHGKLDAAIILANLPWDTMAGALLVREAGGAALDRDGTEHTTDSAATIAVCPGLRAEIMAIVTGHGTG